MIGVIGDGLDILHDIAVTMGDELKKQEQKLDEIDANMDKQQAKLDKNNSTLKGLIKQAKNENKFWQYLCLFIVIAAIGLTLYNMLK